jgi:hypothetical protein
VTSDHFVLKHTTNLQSYLKIITGILDPKAEELTEALLKFYNEVIQNVYTAPSIAMVINKEAGLVACTYGKLKNTLMLVAYTYGAGTLERTIRRWKIY